jgi:hypothetical protein
VISISKVLEKEKSRKKLIEAGLHGNGTNVRKVALFLEKLQMTEKVELSIFAKDNRLLSKPKMR